MAAGRLLRDGSIPNYMRFPRSWEYPSSHPCHFFSLSSRKKLSISGYPHWKSPCLNDQPMRASRNPSSTSWLTGSLQHGPDATASWRNPLFGSPSSTIQHYLASRGQVSVVGFKKKVLSPFLSLRRFAPSVLFPRDILTDAVSSSSGMSDQACFLCHIQDYPGLSV